MILFLVPLTLRATSSFDAEKLLRRANEKFEARFNHMETAALAEGSSLNEESTAQMEARWQSAKTKD